LKKEEKISIEEPKEEKSIDELLEETSFATIELPDVKEKEESFTGELPIIEEEEDFEIQNDEDTELKLLDDREEKTMEEKIQDDDTLESDLFDLIDSMYDKE